MELKIPRLRPGAHSPDFPEPRRTAEKSLTAVIQAAYAHGVSTRSVGDLVEALGTSGAFLHGQSHSLGVPASPAGRTAPLTLGHEFSGTVVESADSGVRVGTRVAVEPECRCGHCVRCRQGHYNRRLSTGFAGLMGNGAMAESVTVTVPSYMVHALPRTCA